MFPFAASGKSKVVSEGGSPELHLLARAPKLKDAVDRVLVSLVKSLQKSSGVPGAIEGSIHELALRDMREVLGACGPDGAASLIGCPTISSTLLVTLDATLMHGLIDLFCGGRGTESPPSSPRNVTPLDQQFAQIVFVCLANAIETEWSDGGFGAVKATKVDRLTPDMLGPRVREVGCVDFSIRLFNLSGNLRLVLPAPALDLFAAGTAAESGEESARVGLWSSRLHQGLGHAPVRLDAYLDAVDIELGSLAALKVGQIMALPASASAHASLVAQGQLLFKGEIGQADDRYTVRIEDVAAEAWQPTAVAAPLSRFQLSEPPRV